MSYARKLTLRFRLSPHGAPRSELNEYVGCRVDFIPYNRQKNIILLLKIKG